MKRKFIAGLAALLLPVWLASACMAELEVRFFSVGKADAMLITAEDGSRILIDAGTNKVGKALAQRFRKEGVDRIDLMIITHFDKDHVGGADQILEECEVARVLIPSYAKESKQHTQFVEALGRSSGTQVTEMKTKDVLELDFGEMHLGITAAHETHYGEDEENDFSLAARLTHGRTRFFFTGDAEAPRQLELLEEGDVACDVLKVPYHGRAVSCSAAFLSACAPKIAWIPDSEEEPANEALVQYLEETLGAEVYRSASDGDLTVLSDGERVWVKE
ncbi:MAG: MBL fold metallo-hydrolase [Clostridia bacterium]|nr:MBL fold metallo-hydrolase [Clostridia bacterium]